MFLVDTNVWLELLLEQQKADEVRQFLARHEGIELAITEFSLYSIWQFRSRTSAYHLALSPKVGSRIFLVHS